MRTFVTTAAVSILLLAATSAPAWAAPARVAEVLRPVLGPILGPVLGNPRVPVNPRGAPGPIAAAGLPFLLVAGAVAAFRRRRKR